MMSVGFASLILAAAALWLVRKHTLKGGYRCDGVFDVVVVAGARVWGGGRPSPALTRRVACGVRCVREGRAARILFTGAPYQGRPSEAEVGRSIALSLGLEACEVQVEEWSTSTRGNARFAYHCLGPHSVLVVTDAYHARRAKLEFERWFVKVGVACPEDAPYPGLWKDLREQSAFLWTCLWPVRARAELGRGVIRAAHGWEVRACMALREEVFQIEGGVPSEIEADGFDEAAHHWIGLWRGRVVSTARVRETSQGVAKVERVAVARAWRGQDCGRKLMERIHKDLRARGFRTATLHAQVSVSGFYERLGYQPHGDVFVEADIPHREMRRSLVHKELESGA